jgi:hypothetical protein
MLSVADVERSIAFYRHLASSWAIRSRPQMRLSRRGRGSGPATLVEAGLNPGEITTPFYAPRGEFELVDPDGYVVMVTHT